MIVSIVRTLIIIGLMSEHLNGRSNSLMMFLIRYIFLKIFCLILLIE